MYRIYQGIDGYLSNRLRVLHYHVSKRSEKLAVNIRELRILEDAFECLIP